MLRSSSGAGIASPQQSLSQAQVPSHPTTPNGKVIRSIRHQRGGSIGKSESVGIIVQPPLPATTSLIVSPSAPSISQMGQNELQSSFACASASTTPPHPSPPKRVTFDLSSSAIYNDHGSRSIGLAGSGPIINSDSYVKNSPVRIPSQRWSPGLLSTIVEVSRESISPDAAPAKLFEDHEIIHKSFLSDYPAWDRMNRDAGNLSYGPLAPSLEPNLRACNRSVISYEDKDDDKEWSSPEEGLLREIERLADHEFDVSHRQAPYSKALEKLFQRLKNDYVVSKRRKMWIESKDQTIKSLQMQLAQSQQKHQQLLKDILVATTSIPLIASSSTDLTEGIDTSIPTEPVPSVSAVAPSAWSDCSIPVEDAFRIKTILSEVNSNGGSVLASSERTPIETQLQTLSDTSLSPLQHQLFLALQNATTNKAMSTASNNRENLPQGGSWDSSTVLSEATTRLLQAETVLGLLKLVMAQNQVEIQGLEEEVARKQSELVHHRLLFDCAIELDRSGYEAQIGEDQVQIRALDNALEASREEARRHVDRIHELVRDIQDLNEVRDRQISNEQALQDRIQRLEDEVDELQFQLLEMERGLESGKKELEDQQAIILVQERQLAEFKAVSERWIASEEQQQEILDHLEKKQQKETSDLKARLTKIQKEKKRLEKEVSTLSVKIVRVQNRNEELEEQAKEDEEALKHMKASVVDKSHNSNDHNEAMVQEILELKAQVTSLDIQIEDLTTSLRLKDAELERTQDEIDNAGFHLEQELAAQRIIHETEMTELAEKKKIQAERERACQSKNVAHFQNMVTKLRTEVDEKDEKLRDLMTSWNQTRDQVQRQEASLRRRRRELEAVQSERDEVQRALTEVNDRLQNVSVAIELLEQAESKNATLVQTIQAKDQALREMEYRLRQLEEEGEELFDADEDEEDDAQGEVRDWRSTDALQRLD